MDAFARLVAISHRTEEERDAMLDSGRSLERDQLGRGVSRDDFCDTIIAILFNGDQLKPALQIKGVACKVYSRKPVLCHLKDEVERCTINTELSLYDFSPELDCECTE